MAAVKKCYNENCECNVDGAYCDACEVTIGDDGMCETYFPKIKANTEDDNGNFKDY
jgi:hypothetical protein